MAGSLPRLPQRFDGEGRNTENFGNFRDSEKVGEIIQIDFSLGWFNDWVLVLVVHV